MKRERATALLKDLVRKAADDAWPTRLISAVHVFGSYARGSSEPGDLDVAVDIDRTDDEWRSHFVRSLSYGRDPYTVLRMALRGRLRSIEILFERQVGHDDVPMTEIWQRGESVQTAFERIDSIALDPTASRAPRDAMLPMFEGLEHRLPRYLRQELMELIDEKVLIVNRLDLSDHDFTGDRLVQDHFDDRWTEGSVLRRAARAALAHLDERGVDLRTVHLHGDNIVQGATTPYFVGFGLRFFPFMLNCFDWDDGLEWIEVIHPTARQPLTALRCRLADRERLAVHRKQTAGSNSFFR